MVDDKKDTEMKNENENKKENIDVSSEEKSGMNIHMSKKAVNIIIQLLIVVMVFALVYIIGHIVLKPGYNNEYYSSVVTFAEKKDKKEVLEKLNTEEDIYDAKNVGIFEKEYMVYRDVREGDDEEKVDQETIQIQEKLKELDENVAVKELTYHPKQNSFTYTKELILYLLLIIAITIIVSCLVIKDNNKDSTN